MQALGEGLRRTAGLWGWRRLIGELARREFRARYAGSTLGIAWAVLEPAVQFGLYLVVFSVILGMRLESQSGVGSFGFYLVAGLVPFMAVQEALGRAVGFGQAGAGLIRHVQAPLEVLLAGSLLAILVRHAVAFVLVIVAAALTGTVAWPGLAWLPVGAVLLIAAVWGLSLVLLPAGAFLPDLAQVVGTGTMIVFFLTPIVYPETVIPSAAAAWLPLNPVVGLLDTFRAGVIGTPVTAPRLAVAGVFALLALVVGCAVFAVRERAVRDVV